MESVGQDGRIQKPWGGCWSLDKLTDSRPAFKLERPNTLWPNKPALRAVNPSNLQRGMGAGGGGPQHRTLGPVLAG